MKQAVDYAANQGIEWVALTNGNIWRVFRVIFAKPIDADLVRTSTCPRESQGRGAVENL